MKRCTVCKQLKEEDEFYDCKTRRSGKAWYCKGCHLKYHEKYRKTEKYSKYQREYQKNYKKGIGKVKFKAQQAAHAAVRSGKIKKAVCELCGVKAEMHHPDYSKPLKVIWICRKHHQWLHRQLKYKNHFK